MRRGRTCGGIRSPRSFSLLGPVANQTAASRRVSEAGRGDWILCQVTSKPYGDARATLLEQTAFSEGSLQLDSYARPGKLFTANRALLLAQVGRLNPERFRQIIESVVTTLRAAIT